MTQEEVFRQTELCDSGRILRYNKSPIDDDFDGVSKVTPDLLDFESSKLASHLHLIFISNNLSSMNIVE